MGGPGSGRQKSPTSGDALIRVVTVLDGANEVAMGFDDMSDSAREYQHTLADGNKENISFAEGNIVMADSVEELNKKQKRTTEEQRDLIIVTQGLTSALNQATGGIYKTIGGLEAWGKIGPKTAADWQKNARILESLTGPLEVMLAGYTAYVALGPAITATIASITGAKTAETAAVTANTVAWYANPMFWAVAVIAASLALLIASLALLADKFNVLTKAVNAAGDALRFFQEESHEAQEAVKGAVDTFVDVITLEPLKEGLVGV